MRKKWKLNNKGMTLLEVIVAFAIFATAATILMVGFNGALKVMGNSNAIKDASQGNASVLNAYGSSELLQQLKNNGFDYNLDKTSPLSLAIKSNGTNIGNITGDLLTVTTEKKNDEMEMSMEMFVANTENLETPPVPIPPVNEGIKWIPVYDDRNNLKKVGSGNDEPFYGYIGEMAIGKINIENNTKGDIYIYVKTGTTLFLDGFEIAKDDTIPRIFFILENEKSQINFSKATDVYSFFIISRNVKIPGKIINGSNPKAPIKIKGNIKDVTYIISEFSLDKIEPFPNIEIEIWESLITQFGKIEDNIK